MRKILILLTIIISCNVFSEEIFIDITGVTKVGSECFFTLEVQDQSNLNFKNIDLLIYSLDINNSLLGKSRVDLQKIRKKQPYKTFTSISMSSVEQCKMIKKADLVVEKCNLTNGDNIDNCLNFFSINKNKSYKNNIEVNFSNNINFYKEINNNDFFIPELNVRLKELDINTAKYYKIKNYKNGLVVVNDNNKSFKKGDLIIEAEMNLIFNVQDLSNSIKLLKSRKKKSILISLVREQQEKVLAVFFK